MVDYAVAASSDTILGTAGADAFKGVNGSYMIYGRQTLVGGAGGDFYAISGSDVIVKEEENGGDDLIISLNSYALPDNVENLISWGYAAIGNALDNRIEASGQINGGRGNDTLIGRERTVYQFDAQSGHDVITNWSGGAAIRLGYSQFTSFGAVQGAMKQDGADVVIKLAADDSVRIQNTHLADLTASNFQLALDTTKLGAMTFADDFNTLNTGIRHSGVGTWATMYSDGGYNSVEGRTLGGNHEQQLYVDPDFAGTSGSPLGLNPFKIENGVLSITASPMPETAKTSAYDFKYMSGVLTNRETFAQTYGYFEAKMQLPAGAGVWPAFWMMRQDHQWPPELDVMEAWGSDRSGGSLAVGTLHTAQNGDHLQEAGISYLADGTTAMHAYGILWTPETLTWYIDGVAIKTAPTPADMHDPMYMIVNLALSPGDIDPNLTSTLKIDYIHAYSLTDVPTIVTGRAALWSGTDYTGSMPTVQDGFNAAYYAAHNKDVVAAGMNLFDHYQQNGKLEGRYAFDPNGAAAGTASAYYDTIMAGGGNASVTATVSHDTYHFGVGFGVDAISGFDVANDRIAVSGLTATYGTPEISAMTDGRGASIRWSGGETLQLIGLTVDDARAALAATPFAALPAAQAAWGKVDGIVDGFNAAFYGAHNPDVVATNMDLLKHYEFYGKAEGRLGYDASAPTIVLADLNGSTGGASGTVPPAPNMPSTVPTPPTPTPTPTPTAPTPTPPPTPTMPSEPVVTVPPVVSHADWGAVAGVEDGFNAAFYAAHNLDVVASGMGLQFHFQQYGRMEGRAAYDPNGAAADSAAASYLIVGSPNGNTTLDGSVGQDHFYLPSGFVTQVIRGFDTAHDTLDVSALIAKAGNPTVAAMANAAGARVHWSSGETLELLGVSSSDAARILHVADTPAGPERPAHGDWGAVAGVQDGFNAAFYAAHNLDVVASGMDLLTHYERYGKNEGRAAYDPNGAAADTAAATYLTVAGPGNATFEATAAHDIFYLAPGIGTDVIRGFDAGRDTLNVSALSAKYGGPTFADMAGGAGTELHWAGGETVQLLGMTIVEAQHAVLG